VGNFLGGQGLIINIINIIEIVPTETKFRFLIKMNDSTPTKWDKYLSLEAHIQKLCELENCVRENVNYNNKEHTISVDIKFNNDISRERLNTSITSLLNENGITQVVLDAVEFKDYNDDLIDLPNYKANKLIDKALDQLQKM